MDEKKSDVAVALEAIATVVERTQVMLMQVTERAHQTAMVQMEMAQRVQVERDRVFMEFVERVFALLATPTAPPRTGSTF
jgi:predicted XRE-type DNA-binding protein